MIFIDLVSSVSRALPWLVAVSARRPHDEMVFGSKIGYAFVSPNRSDTSEPIDIENATTWLGLQATTLGILGTGRIGQAVARITYQRFGADVVHQRSVTSADIEFDDRGQRQSFDDVIAARTICVVLPWSADLLGQIHKNKLTQVNPESVLVVWRRSLAIERALSYIGQHYVEPIQLCDLAKVACVSKCHLVRRFTATLGVSPHRFQLLLRLSRAKAMLREGTCITHIAQGVGFFDHSHLDRSFRILLGMTPTQYQQSVDR
jgi:AraC family transcriptional regulator